MHSYFEDLRLEKTTLPNGSPLPDLFNFKEEELLSADPQIKDQLIPDWYVPKKEQEEKQKLQDQKKR